MQDYHFALLPRMIRERLPDATIITFWHIPWPNPEAFAICPWRTELLDGLLGSSILGFHTQFHCNNFLDTVDRHARSARRPRVVHDLVPRRDRPPCTAIRSRSSGRRRRSRRRKSVPEARRAVRERLGLPREPQLGVGIDRLDYTKGIIERFNAVARLLEIEPRWIGRFTFVQIAAPSRGTIDDYRDYAGARARAAPPRSTSAIADAKYPPIVLLAEHHEPDAVYEYHRAADLCFVSSLHDGMNLVAKEFVAARDDEQGVLILSQFAGASRELPEALIVNPYDADQCAAALHLALTMPADEQRDRMRFMRGVVREFNVYRWAGRMLLDAAVMRQRGRFRADRSVAAPWLTRGRRRSRRTRRRARARAPAPRPPPPLDARLRAVPRHRRHAARSRADARSRARRRRASPRCCRRSPRELGGAVALITGRAIADADRLFPGARAARRRASTASSAAPPTARSTCTRRRCAGSSGCGASSRGSRRGTTGLLLEDKGATLALHYRQAPRLASHVHRTLRAHAGARPAVSADGGCSRARGSSKSSRTGATRARRSSNTWRSRRSRDALPVFVGDDLTDEYGFVAVTAPRRVGGEGRARRRRARATGCPTSRPCATGSARARRRSRATTAEAH